MPFLRSPCRWHPSRPLRVDFRVPRNRLTWRKGQEILADQVAVKGFRAVTAPLGAVQTAPAALPGTLMPSPVSAVTLAANFSALLPEVGHFFAEVLVNLGAAMVVVLPLTQSTVPPWPR